MNKYQIRGGNRLHGTIEISGAKNAAVAILPAALLVDGACRIENIPQISDVTALTLPATPVEGVESMERRLVVVDKVKPTPAAYPRHGSKIAKKPL